MTTDPAEELRAAAELAAQSGDPLHTALANWLDVAALVHNATVKAAAEVWDDPAEADARDAFVARQTDHAALAVARQVLSTVTAPPETEAAPAVDRAAILREAADVAVRAARACGESETGQYAAAVAAGIGRDLRRLADEAPQPTITALHAACPGAEPGPFHPNLCPCPCTGCETDCANHQQPAPAVAEGPKGDGRCPGFCIPCITDESHDPTP